MRRLLFWVVMFLLPITPLVAQEEGTSLERATQDALQAIQQGVQGELQQLEAIQKRLDALTKVSERVQKEAEEIVDFRAETGKRFKELNKDLAKRSEESGKRLDDFRGEINRRVELYEQAVLVMFGVLVLLLLLLFRSVGRDRSEDLKPLEEKLASMEERQLHDARNLQTNITRLKSLLDALRTLAREDPKVAAVLRAHALME
ncbi:MAG: hypothetical protein H7836_10925 [Magnetococcus sp. YQC-3]